MRAGECELAHTSTLATRSKLRLAAQIVSRIARLAQGADAGEKGWEPSWPKLRTDHVLAGRPGVHPSSETRKLGIGCVCCWLRGPEPQMMLPNLADCTRRRQPEVAKSDTPRLGIAKTTISASFPKLARNPGVKNRTHDDCQCEQHPILERHSKKCEFLNQPVHFSCLPLTQASFRSQLWFCRQAGQRKGIVIPDRESNVIASVVARSAP